LRSFAHSSLLRAAFFHLLTPRICVFWATPSSHRNFGLPTLLENNHHSESKFTCKNLKIILHIHILVLMNINRS
jgi:hypothetical protein